MPAPAVFVVWPSAVMIMLVGLAAERERAGIGQHLALVDVGLELVEMVDPVAGVEVLQLALDRSVVDVHHRHHAVPRLGRGTALADLLEHGRAATTPFFTRTVSRSLEPIRW